MKEGREGKRKGKNKDLVLCYLKINKNTETQNNFLIIILKNEYIHHRFLTTK